MDRPIIILGAGGHAKVVLDALLQQGVHILGIVDHDVARIGEKILGVSIIGDDAHVLQYDTKKIYLVNGLGSIGSTKVRRELFIKFKGRGYNFATIIHSSAIIAKDVQLQEGTQVMAGAVLQTGSIIGENSIINTRVAIDHDCVIGSHAHISPGATICGGVTVGMGTHIGAGATIIQEIKVESGCIIGAGSLVIRDVTTNSIAYGNPAKEVKR